ncbi:hypothetical protein GW17_00049509 [Ensete ventricosum]|nr:hypothetical protein GW17_00049509 [Ensete ventricosum]
MARTPQANPVAFPPDTIGRFGSHSHAPPHDPRGPVSRRKPTETSDLAGPTRRRKLHERIPLTDAPVNIILRWFTVNLSGGFLFAWPPPEVSLPAPPPFSPVTGGGRTPWRPSHAPLFRHASPPIATTWCRSRPLTISVRLPPPSFLHSSPSALASTTFPHLLLLLL